MVGAGSYRGQLWFEKTSGNFHVDDLTLSVPSDNGAEKLVSISVKVMKDAGMSLRKWVTNSSEIYNRMAEKKLLQDSFEDQE